MFSRRSFLKSMSVMTAAGVTVINMPGVTKALAKATEEKKKVLELDKPYLGTGLIIASLAQLTTAGIVANGASIIQDADALDPKDIIIANDKIAIAIGVISPDPWGYPVGSVLDMAQVSGKAGKSVADGFKSGSLKVSEDRLWDMRLLMNSWDSWSPSNCGTPSFEIVENYKFDDKSAPNPALKVILEYKENSPDDPQTFTEPMIIETYYSLAPQDDYVKVKSIIKNSTSKTFKARATGFNFSSKSTRLTSPGTTVYNENTKKAQNDFIAIYHPEYTNGLIVPGVEDVYEGTGYADSYSMYDYAPNTQTEIVAYMRTDSTRDISNTTDQMLEIKGVPASEIIIVSGQLLDNNKKPIPNGIVAVERTNGEDWTFVTWASANDKGEYSIKLTRPNKLEEYRLYGMEEDYAITTDAEKLVLSGSLPKGENVAITTAPLTLTKAVPLVVNVKDQNGKPLYSKIQIMGLHRPTVGYIANSLFYSDFENNGVNKVLVAPGDFEIEVSNGIDFFTKGVRIKGNTETDKEINVTLETVGDLRAEGWYNTDLHHHTYKSDACTSPEEFVRSNLGAAINVAYVSDHDDSSANIEVFNVIKDNKLDIEFIPGVEISASWSHFNVLPRSQAARDFMLSTSKESGGKYKFNQYGYFKDIVDSVHAKDMYFIANHPWSFYGLFSAENLGNVYGGNYDQYDLIEMNGDYSGDEDNVSTINSARERWTKALTGGKKYFLTGSSDTHDVFKTLGKYITYSGMGRTFVKVQDKNNLLDDFAKQMALGHAYVSNGPLLSPSDEQMFGNTFNVKNGENFEISLPVKSVNGIAKVEIYGKDGLVAEQKFNNPTDAVFKQAVKATADNWYQVVVTDSKNKQAHANPYFITVS